MICKRPDVLRLAIPLLLALVPGFALADPPKGFAEHVEQLRQDSGAPGIAIAIVEHGQTTLSQGWGVRQQAESARVDERTIFPTGSTGKAFTVAAIATLVDQGKLGWDDKVIDHIPWFQMYDPWVTREITIRDLMVHRSGLGLGAGDLMFVPRTYLSRKETVERLRYIKPATSFRSAYAYDNVLYVVLGQLIEEVTGKTWEEYMASEVLARGGMTDSTATYDARYATANRALPHGRVGDVIRGLGPNSVLDERNELGRNAMPAGGLAMSANDLAQWLKIQLGHGALPSGGRLFSEDAAREMWTPVTIQPIDAWPDDLAPATPQSSAYALGWDVETYRGARMIWHSGGVFGAIAVVVLLPDQDVGFAIVINSEEAALRRGLMYELIDHYLGLPDNDWYAKWDKFVDARLEGGKAALAQMQDKPAQVGPSLPLGSYAGTYRDPWYGDVVVSERDGGLWINFASTPRMEGRLVHYQYDTFKTELTDKAVENALVTFQLDAHGKVERAKMVAASPLADFSYDYQDLDLTPVKDKP
ncbi:serine hydrolase [Altererythrobacter sp. Root672]|uniref:serine hydrolase n=1 Tax=Altererythrobacter sp. Root672 TaxID=1736584 RepID=UPI0006FF171A|nr:serine hydrolase [Altererythrobacter sp. Root672]KRA82651.1 serine hydrolase [Altererythrobacter sp. Root672]